MVILAMMVIVSAYRKVWWPDDTMDADFARVTASMMERPPLAAGRSWQWASWGGEQQDKPFVKQGGEWS